MRCKTPARQPSPHKPALPHMPVPRCERGWRRLCAGAIVEFNCGFILESPVTCARKTISSVAKLTRLPRQSSSARQGSARRRRREAHAANNRAAAHGGMRVSASGGSSPKGARCHKFDKVVPTTPSTTTQQPRSPSVWFVISRTASSTRFARGGPAAERRQARRDWVDRRFAW